MDYTESGIEPDPPLHEVLYPCSMVSFTLDLPVQSILKYW